MEFVNEAFGIFEVLDVTDEHADSDPTGIFSFKTFWLGLDRLHELINVTYVDTLKGRQHLLIVLNLRSSVAQPLESLSDRLEIHVLRVAHVGA